MVRFLAVRNLARQRARTVLTVLGLAVSTALLYDMALLSGGLRASLGAVLADIGYELRVLPKGNLPFSSEATLTRGRALARELAAIPGVARAEPLWGTALYLSRAGGGARDRAGGGARDRVGDGAHARPLSAFALGLDPGGARLARIESGSPPRPVRPGEPIGIVLNRIVADSLAVTVGDTLLVSTALDAVSRLPARPVIAIVSGVARFRLDMRAQRTVNLRLADLQAVAGRQADDPASFITGKLVPGADAGPIVAAFQRAHPEVDVTSVAALLREVRGQLSYFDQFSLILGSVSLLVTFLLILTLLTLSVNERQGEIALLRALGLRASRVVRMVLLEGFALAVLAAGPGVALGAVASRGLDAILKSSPGIPADLSFFVFTPAALARTLVLLIVTGTVAGAYPAFLAARTNIVATLHREVT